MDHPYYLGTWYSCFVFSDYQEVGQSFIDRKDLSECNLAAFDSSVHYPCDPQEADVEDTLLSVIGGLLWTLLV